MEHELPDNILGRSPVSNEGPLNDSRNLRRNRHGKLPIIIRLALRVRTPPFPSQPLNLFRSLLLLFRPLPHVPKILPFVVWVPGADDLEHPLGGVLVLLALFGAVGLEVRCEGLGIMAQLAVIDDATAGFKKDKFIELLEEDTEQRQSVIIQRLIVVT